MTLATGRYQFRAMAGRAELPNTCIHHYSSQPNSDLHRVYCITDNRISSLGIKTDRAALLGLAISSVSTSSFLQEMGETGVRVYREDVLQGDVKHLNTTLFRGKKWVFQQDSVPPRKAKTTQESLWRNFPAFVNAENWLLGSADLKPPDNKLWALLEDMVCRNCHNSLESLRRSLLKAAAEIPLET